ncbi:MAG: hypothetical protein ACK44D_07670 [Bacteroidia bacterium]
MKKVILSASILVLGAIAANAQTAAPATPAPAAVKETTAPAAVKAEEPSLKLEELPEAVRKTLATDEFKGMEFVSAKLVKAEAGEFYGISLKQADKTVVIKLNKEGKKVN